MSISSPPLCPSLLYTEFAKVFEVFRSTLDTPLLPGGRLRLRPPPTQLLSPIPTSRCQAPCLKPRDQAEAARYSPEGQAWPDCSVTTALKGPAGPTEGPLRSAECWPKGVSLEQHPLVTSNEDECFLRGKSGSCAQEFTPP